MTGEHRGALILDVLPAGDSPQNNAPSPTIAAAMDQAQTTDTDCSKDEKLHDMPVVLDENQDDETSKHYSVFTETQKQAIVFSGSFFGLLSYMNSSIFYPAINQVCTSVMSPPYFPNIL